MSIVVKVHTPPSLEFFQKSAAQYKVLHTGSATYGKPLLIPQCKNPGTDRNWTGLSPLKTVHSPLPPICLRFRVPPLLLTFLLHEGWTLLQWYSFPPSIHTPVTLPWSNRSQRKAETFEALKGHKLYVRPNTLFVVFDVVSSRFIRNVQPLRKPGWLFVDLLSHAMLFNTTQSPLGKIALFPLFGSAQLSASAWRPSQHLKARIATVFEADCYGCRIIPYLFALWPYSSSTQHCSQITQLHTTVRLYFVIVLFIVWWGRRIRCIFF